MRSLILVAGGSGSRMEKELPKQFIPLHGIPLFIHTLRLFRQFDPLMEVILVFPRQEEERMHGIRELYPELDTVIFAYGGSSRTASVWSGLEKVNGSLVGIHDAVRPLVSLETIQRCYAKAEKGGSAVPVIALEDSLRELHSKTPGKSIPKDRKRFKRVQTPQVFGTLKIMAAYREAAGKSFPDDASLYENHWGAVELVEGNRENIKVTYSVDLRIAEALLKEQKNQD